MSEIVKHYTNGEVTVVWKPSQCIHSAICFRGLPGVFNPRIRPWVTIDGASTDAIVKQVKECPSGALSYHYNNERQDAEHLEAKVEVLPNGPLLVYGTLHIKDRNGNESIKNKTTAFCRCGASKNKPYCDGSHVGAQFSD
ncbi:MAG: (4Fe-4S)-binding protein [Chitinophagales bacterium]|nr:(4Fe-4S)-binding protein [Chitinophagales bacterium]